MIYSQLVEICNQFEKSPALTQGNTILPFGNLLNLVKKSQRNLIQSGITPGQRVLVIGKNSIQLIALFFALAKNENTLISVDPNSTKEELSQLVNVSECDCIVFQHNFKALLPNDFQTLPIVESAILDEFYFCGKGIIKSSWWQNLFGNKIAEEAIEGSAPRNKTEEFLVLFSSGSSGSPKGVRLSQSALYHQFLYWRNHADLNNSDKVLSALTISHSHGMMLIFPSLLSGAHVHLIQAEQLNPDFVCNYCSENSITMISGIPLLYHLLLNQDTHFDHRLQTLRYAICGSAPMSATMAKNFYKKYGVHIRQAYGLTETGPVCVNMFENGEYNYQLVGRMISGYEYRIIDEAGEDVPNGAEGELIIRSKANAEGFLNAKDEEEKMFKSEGWLHTQDIVKETANRELIILGRKTSFINVSGFKVYPAEVERMLLSHPDIRQAAVVGSKDEKLGEVVHAYVVSNTGLTEREIRKHCIDNLSTFKVPKLISIVDDLPKNSIGKVKYAELS